ncbi:hypothetical protein [Tenacibaculum sp. 190524A05c]|uniref:hypothetical protein n=1 Tax=Tenacibaculum platacis TaxID=3137852 RepID=UPI0031FAF13C
MSKILWVCKESFTSISNFTIPRFNDFENEVIFIHPTESLLQDQTYLNFKENHKSLKIHTLDNLSKKYASAFMNKTINYDRERLKEIENKYCDKLTWGELLMSSQIFTTPYHYRFYFKDLTDSEKNYWVLLLFDYFENLLSISKPDYIFDFDNSEIGRTVLWMVAEAMGIPYITIEHTRYKGVLIPNFNLGRWVDDYFIEYFNNIKEELYLKEVVNFRESEKIINEDYKNNKTTKKKNNSLFFDLKRLYFYEKTVISKSLRKRKLLGRKFVFPFLATFKESFIFFIQMVFRERYLLSNRNPYFKDPVENENYIYFPLHLIPESSTLIKAPFYPNEEEVISRIAKSLPLGWKLYIKEHGAMIGERPLSFYKKVSRLSNVKFIKLDAYNDPKTWILKSKGVITITGTSSFEAAMLGKSSVVLGSVPFKMIKGVNSCADLNNLSEIIRNKFEESNLDNILSCENYIQTIYKYGEPVQFTLMHNSCYKALNFNEKITEEVEREILKTVNVFRKGINILEGKF